MPFDPAFPSANSHAASAAMRDQLNALKALIDAVPAGPPGPEGPQGPPGQPGEVTTASLDAAIAGTARNPVGLTTLDTPFADPDAEALRLAHNALLEAIFRPPV